MKPEQVVEVCGELLNKVRVHRVYLSSEVKTEAATCSVLIVFLIYVRFL